MDQILKIMLGLYAAIMLSAAIVGVTITGSVEESVAATETAALAAKVKSADGELRGNQPFNQVGFKIDDKSSHKPFNVVRFEGQPHQAFNQVGFSTSGVAGWQQSGKPSGNSHGPAEDRSAHRPVNNVRFESRD